MQSENDSSPKRVSPASIVWGAWLFVVFHYLLLGWLYYFFWILESIGRAWGDGPSSTLRIWGIVFLIIAAIFPTYALRIAEGERKVAIIASLWCRLVAWIPLPLFLAGALDKEFLFLGIMSLPLSILGIVSALLRSDSAIAWFDYTSRNENEACPEE